ncbi:MAG: hypothetical protein OXQ89_02810 [Rhodospirillaceae bacterium]|nr:hypothetical protein [Rhodospirillaceae bacterium]
MQVVQHCDLPQDFKLRHYPKSQPVDDVEAAWSYRFAARKTGHLQRKAALAPPRVQDLAWAAQKRLCGRYRRLSHAGKAYCQVTTAVARELAGFIWAIACEMAVRPHGSHALA